MPTTEAVRAKLEEWKTDEEVFKRTLRKLYVEEDLTAAETANQMGISVYFVKNYMRKFGIKRRSRGQRAGKRSMRWKGGRIRKNGYVMIWSPDHPSRQESTERYVFEHRLVMEAYIGRHLEAHEVVHHKNGVRDDNRIENLELTDQKNHIRQHFVGKPMMSYLFAQEIAQEIVGKGDVTEQVIIDTLMEKFNS